MARMVVSACADDDVGTMWRQMRIAERYAQAFEAAYERLATFPRIGPTRSALGPHTRIWIVPSYVMTYDDVDDTVTGALLARRDHPI